MQIAETLFSGKLSFCGDLMMKNAPSKLWTTLAPDPDWNRLLLSA